MPARATSEEAGVEVVPESVNRCGIPPPEGAGGAGTQPPKVSVMQKLETIPVKAIPPPVKFRSCALPATTEKSVTVWGPVKKPVLPPALPPLAKNKNFPVPAPEIVKFM